MFAFSKVSHLTLLFLNLWFGLSITFLATLQKCPSERLKVLSQCVYLYKFQKKKKKANFWNEITIPCTHYLLLSINIPYSKIKKTFPQCLQHHPFHFLVHLFWYFGVLEYDSLAFIPNKTEITIFGYILVEILGCTSVIQNFFQRNSENFRELRDRIVSTRTVCNTQ